MIYQVIANLYIEDELLAQEIYDFLRNKASNLSIQKLNGALEQSSVRLMLNKHLEGQVCDTLNLFYLDEDSEIVEGEA